jgi:hypothetical protein
MSIAHRRSLLGCPFCANRRVSCTNSLATVEKTIAREWHPTKNGKLQPTDVVYGSGRKVWWQCPKGPDHEWKMSIFARRSLLGCPFCANHRVS